MSEWMNEWMNDLELWPFKVKKCEEARVGPLRYILVFTSSKSDRFGGRTDRRTELTTDKTTCRQWCSQGQKAKVKASTLKVKVKVNAIGPQAKAFK